MSRLAQIVFLWLSTEALLESARSSRGALVVVLRKIPAVRRTKNFFNPQKEKQNFLFEPSNKAELFTSS
jgi:hypothetical protein